MSSIKNNKCKMTTKLQENNTSKQVYQNEYYIKTIDLTGKIYSNQTDQFPVISSKGKNIS